MGTQAYADYVNSTGGVNGRKIVVNSADDGFTGAGNKQATQNAVNNDFALVGGFSTFDSYGGTVLAENPGMPDVSQVLDPATNKLPNVYSAVPLDGGWEEGPLQYFKHKFGRPPSQHAGTFLADLPSAEADWAGEKYVMQKVGYKFVYDQTYAATQTDFTQNVIAMKNAGVKIIFMDQMPENYASALLKDLAQQNFHPRWSSAPPPTRTPLIPAAGGRRSGQRLLPRPEPSLYLGEDAVRRSPPSHLPPLGQCGLARVQPRPVHPVRLAVGRAVRPGPEERRVQPEPGLAAPGAVQGHHVQRWQHRDHQQPGGPDHVATAT